MDHIEQPDLHFLHWVAETFGCLKIPRHDPHVHGKLRMLLQEEDRNQLLERAPYEEASPFHHGKGDKLCHFACDTRAVHNLDYAADVFVRVGLFFGQT